jgi:hypothetical protein
MNRPEKEKGKDATTAGNDNVIRPKKPVTFFGDPIGDIPRRGNRSKMKPNFLMKLNNNGSPPDFTLYNSLHQTDS